MKKRVTYTIDDDIVRHVEKTKGKHSASERANELMRRGMRKDIEDEIARQARQCFAVIDPDERAERDAYLKLTKQSWARDVAGEEW